MRRRKYLNNRDLLREIHKSKVSFSSFVNDETDNMFDVIVNDLSEINDELIKEAKQSRASRHASLAFEEHHLAGGKKKEPEFVVDPNSFTKQDLVFRLMTFDHIPDDLLRKKTHKTIADTKVKLNFPPFKHYRFDDNDTLICVGKSHWIGGMENGYFSLDHGKPTDNLVRMWIKLCEKYASRGNLRGYCVDDKTKALTDRGWLSFNEITTDDKILSFEYNKLKWSEIKSIYVDNYEGLMFKTTHRGLDSLVTPNHKFMTRKGLKTVEKLRRTDEMVLIGEHVEDVQDTTNKSPKYENKIVELAGWLITKADSILTNDDEVYKKKIYSVLTELKYQFTKLDVKKGYHFVLLNKDLTLQNLINGRQLNNEFVLSLSHEQRLILIDFIKQTNNKRTYDKDTSDVIQVLFALSGMRTISEVISPDVYTIEFLHEITNTVTVKKLDFHNKKRTGKRQPVVKYNGTIWCPKTEYGCFIAQRNGTVFLTGNTYNDEMIGQSILQLTQVGLQFNEQRSDNPFSYYSQCAGNSAIKIINSEKKAQRIRDDILEANNMAASYTREAENDWEHAKTRWEETEDRRWKEKKNY